MDSKASMEKTIIIISWNINGIKAHLGDLRSVIKEKSPDIILLQEIKCTIKNFPYEDFKDYHVVVHSQKAYNGVAILSKYPINRVITTLSKSKRLVKEARYVEASVVINKKIIKVVSVYVPQGRSPNDKESFSYKLYFLDLLKKRLKLLSPHKNLIIVGGDFNVSTYGIIYDGVISRTAKEQEKFQNILDIGFHDVYRTFHPKGTSINLVKDLSNQGDIPVFIKKPALQDLDHILISKKGHVGMQSFEIIKFESEGGVKYEDKRVGRCIHRTMFYRNVGHSPRLCTYKISKKAKGYNPSPLGKSVPTTIFMKVKGITYLKII